MSANNELLIYLKNGKYCISDTDTDTGSGHLVGFHEGYETLFEAVNIANNYMEENEVEYGLHIITQPK